MIIIGQRKALMLAVRDWRRVARQTALDGLLGGGLRFEWLKHASESLDPGDTDPALWEALLASSIDG